MSKGFTLATKDERKTRDSLCTDFTSTFAWAVSNRPGANPINGGRGRWYADRSRNAYARFRRSEKRRIGRAEIGRYTAPKPARPVADTEESVES